ncbi:MAG: ANTAR domain-containing protein [Betaproteobacteria bacterium]|nr:ANTAR domain-containing protein [Betaproteobacteria bacterium]
MNRRTSPPPPKSASLKIVLVDDDPDRAASVRGALARGDCEVVSLLATPIELYRAVAELKPDVIIISSESPSRDAIEHIALLNREAPRPVVMFSGDRSSDTIRAAIRAGVSAYVVDGLAVERLMPILEVAVERFEAEQALREELSHTRTQLAERKTIERAKGIVMKQKQLDEEAAFQELRRFAMDKGIKMAEAAQQVIELAKTYG